MLVKYGKPCDVWLLPNLHDLKRILNVNTPPSRHHASSGYSQEAMWLKTLGRMTAQPGGFALFPGQRNKRLGITPLKEQETKSKGGTSPPSLLRKAREGQGGGDVRFRRSAHKHTGLERGPLRFAFPILDLGHQPGH